MLWEPYCAAPNFCCNIFVYFVIWILITKLKNCAVVGMATCCAVWTASAACACVCKAYMCNSESVNWIGVLLIMSLYSKDADSKTNQWRCNHIQWSEANVRQQYRQRTYRLVAQMLTVPITINPEEKHAVWSWPGSILTFRDLRLTSTLLG